MIGIIFLFLLSVWGLIALFLGKMLLGWIRSFKKQSPLENSSWSNSKTTLLQIGLASLIFVLPIADEIISYPSYYYLCQDAGKYEFAPGMDAKEAFGREYVMKFKNEKLTGLFPWFHEVTNDKNEKSVLVKEMQVNLVDINTNEVILISRIVVPISSFFAIPWDGERHPWLLHSCTTEKKESNELIKSLQLKRIYRFD